METPQSLQIPLFPLNNVLFPGGALPLQIFEPRYLEMIARRHAAGEPFGVVCLSEGREVRSPGADSAFAPEAVHPVGTLARIDELQRLQPGLLVIDCTGTRSFRVLRSEQGQFGLWVAEVRLLPEEAVVEVPADLAFVRDGLQALTKEVREQAERGNRLLLREPHLWNDCGWLANRWCELLPFSPHEKQRLLELESPLLRLELVADAINRMGVKG